MDFFTAMQLALAKYFFKVIIAMIDNHSSTLPEAGMSKIETDWCNSSEAPVTLADSCLNYSYFGSQKNTSHSLRGQILHTKPRPRFYQIFQPTAASFPTFQPSISLASISGRITNTQPPFPPRSLTRRAQYPSSGRVAVITPSSVPTHDNKQQGVKPVCFINKGPGTLSFNGVKSSGASVSVPPIKRPGVRPKPWLLRYGAVETQANNPIMITSPTVTLILKLHSSSVSFVKRY